MAEQESREALDPSDRCEWEDCPKAWMGCVTIEWRQSDQAPVPSLYWFCSEHMGGIKHLLDAHHQERAEEA